MRLYERKVRGYRESCRIGSRCFFIGTMKSILAKYPIDPRQIDSLNHFMLFHGFQTVELMVAKTDEDLFEMDGCSIHLILEIRKLRKIILSEKKDAL